MTGAGRPAVPSSGLTEKRCARTLAGMKRIPIYLLLLASAACQKPAQKDETVKTEEPKAAAPVLPTTTAEAVTGQTPGQMVDQAKQVAETANANSAEKTADMETDQ